MGFVMEVQCIVNDLGTAFLHATYKNSCFTQLGIKNIYQEYGQ
jgi:hypothetical protein